MRNREDNPDQCHFCGRTTADGIKLVIGPAGANICTDCAKQAIELGSNLKGKRKPKPIGRIPTPAEIVARLDQYVIGQEDSKKTLAVAVYNHYCRLAAKDGYDSEGNRLSKDDLEELANVEIEKSNVLMIGPTGCGKTLLAKTIAKMLDVPFAIADATTLTEAGYVGEDVENIVRYAYNNAGKDVERTKRAIVWIDECFPGDTEVMTENGFKQFDELTMSDKIVQWNEDGSMSVVDPERIVKHPYDGELLTIRHSNGDIIHSSTPNHNRVLISQGKNKFVRKIQAKDSLSGGWKIPVAGNLDGNGLPIPDAMIQFHVAFAADGCIKNGRYGYISFKKDRKKERLDRILKETGIEYSYHFNERHKYHCYYFGRMDNIKLFAGFDKSLVIPGFIHSTLHQKHVFLEELKYWDGYLNYGRNNPVKSMYFSTAKREEADFVQTISHLSGYYCTVFERVKAGYKKAYACVCREKAHQTQQRINAYHEKYKGNVYCVTVPSHMIMIRQEGRVCITGNCDKLASKTQNVSLTRDVSGEGVQQALLKIVEGTVCRFPPNGGRKHPDQELVEIDTSDILFICGGAFVGLDKIVEQRIGDGHHQIGFASKDESDRLEEAKKEAKVRPEDLVKFGLIPELVGRLPVVTEMRELTEEELMRVLTEPKNALTKQYKKLLRLSNVRVEFDEASLRKMARMAIERKTGARGLKAEMENLMRDVMFRIPDKRKVGEVVRITEDMFKEAA